MCKKLYILILSCVVLLTSASCRKKDPAPELPTRFEIGEVALGDLHLTLLSDQEALWVGYNPVYISVKNEQGQTPAAPPALSMNPLMDMHSMEHSSPAVQPVFNSRTGMYEGAIVFTMPSGDMGTWKIGLELLGETADVDVDIQSAPAQTKPVGSYQDDEGNRYWISLVEPRKPHVGVQDLHIMVHQQVDMHHFPPVSDLEIELEPVMPSMGHGSPNNVNPLPTGNGVYKGRVNFTMTGDWRLNFTLKREGTMLVENGYLDILF